MNDNLNDASRLAAQRAQQYWLVDGIAELVMGSFFVILGIYFGAQAILPADSFAGSMLAPAMLLVVVGGMLVARALIRRLKERLTYRRTGYVAYRQPSKKRRWLTAALGFGMAVLISALFARAPGLNNLIPAITGILIGAYWLYYGHQIGVARFYLLAALSTVTGGAISLSGVQQVIGLPLFYIILGISLLVSGGITLWIYLRNTSQPGEGPG